MFYRADKQTEFCSGSIIFSDHAISVHESVPKIYLIVEIEGFQTEAAVDTGGAYLVVSPEIADYLDFKRSHDTPQAKLSIRGTETKGFLYSARLRLVAQEGYSLEMYASAYVPELDPSTTWGDLPPVFLGYFGCLERLCFAIEPQSNKFYFGEGN